MSNTDFDPAQLNESQQLALGTYTAVTNQEPSAAVPLLQRSEWNVQVWLQLRMEKRKPTFHFDADMFYRLLSPNSSMEKPQIQWQKLAPPNLPLLHHLGH